MEKQRDKVIADKSTPVSFPRWREVLKSEYSDPEAIRKLEQDIFAHDLYPRPQPAGACGAQPSRQPVDFTDCSQSET